MSGWRAVLTGEQASAARGAIEDIARALADATPERLTDATLFWAYASDALPFDWVFRAYDRTAEALAESVQRGFGNDIGLYHGASGAGFVMAHVAEPNTVDESLAMIDGAIADRLALPWLGSFDLIDGLVGVGVYLLQRVDESPAARAALGRVVHHLALAAEIGPLGATWRTPASALTEEQRIECPDGHHNCGLAHGVPGIVALLGRATERAGETARSLAELSFDWLVAHGTLDDALGRYPSWLVGDVPNAPARTGWCYGDPGVAIALWDAASRLGRPVEPFVELARASTKRDTGVVDASLCHGAAGLAHIYNRCYQACGDEAFAEAARSWFARALAMRREGGIGGFAAWENERWTPSTTLLEGAVGVGLALLAAIEPVEPAWDRMLLCDLPPR